MKIYWILEFWIAQALCGPGVMKNQKHYLNLDSHFNISEFAAAWNALIIIRLPLSLVVEIGLCLFKYYMLFLPRGKDWLDILIGPQMNVSNNEVVPLFNINSVCNWRPLLRFLGYFRGVLVLLCVCVFTGNIWIAWTPSSFICWRALPVVLKWPYGERKVKSLGCRA